MLKTGMGEYDAMLAVARLRSFRAAATELGMSPSALSQTIAALEARLNLRLFDRTTRSVSVTEAGEQFINRIAPALATISGAIEGINGHRDRPAETLRINAAIGAARMVLTPIILTYLRRYPAVNIILVTETPLVDIGGPGFDAGIRIAEAVPQDMIAIPIGSAQRQVVVGSPAYFRGRPKPLVPGDLLRHQCIRARMASGAIDHWTFERHGEKIQIDVPGQLTLDETTLITEAALAGTGLAFVSAGSARDHLAAGTLISVLDDWTPSYPGLCLYFPGRRHVPASLRALIALILETNAAAVADAAE